MRALGWGGNSPAVGSSPTLRMSLGHTGQRRAPGLPRNARCAGWRGGRRTAGTHGDKLAVDKSASAGRGFDTGRSVDDRQTGAGTYADTRCPIDTQSTADSAAAPASGSWAVTGPPDDPAAPFALERVSRWSAQSRERTELSYQQTPGCPPQDTGLRIRATDRRPATVVQDMVRRRAFLRRKGWARSRSARSGARPPRALSDVQHWRRGVGHRLASSAAPTPGRQL
jgi:hypothetical protein